MTVAEVLDYFTPKLSPSRCWEWQGKLGPNGYGILTVGHRGFSAHRVSYELAVGPIPDGQMLLHSCDNRRCVNPKHLRPGSHADNMLDRQLRLRTPQGQKVGGAKLAEDEVREIRRLWGEGASEKELAEQYRVTRGAIYLIVIRKNWKHVV